MLEVLNPATEEVVERLEPATEGDTDAAVARANLARIALTLTTRDPGAMEDDDSSGFAATIRDALSVLGTILTWTAAVAIVATPFVLLSGLAALGVRRARRRAEERLLEQA